MNEPKKRGPKPRCKECGRKEGEGHGDDCPVGIGATVAAFQAATGIVVPASTPLAESIRRASNDIAQAYALRVWAGQSESETRTWRLERVRLALEGQGMSMEGVELPNE